jgi:type IV pilus assembly protein PilX
MKPMRTSPSQAADSRGIRVARARPGAPRAAQQGVVLIIALVMLVVISLLTTLSIRSAVSTESVSGNVRTTELASQAAEIALRYCEDAVAQLNGGTGSLTSTPSILAEADPPRWKSMATWDGNASDPFVIPTEYVNQATGAETYKRRPECIVERMPVVKNNGGVKSLTTTSTFVITARGFGPEVAAADGARKRPQGSEVWMQSTIELK